MKKTCNFALDSWRLHKERKKMREYPRRPAQRPRAWAPGAKHGRLDESAVCTWRSRRGQEAELEPGSLGKGGASCYIHQRGCALLHHQGAAASPGRLRHQGVQTQALCQVSPQACQGLARIAVLGRVRTELARNPERPCAQLTHLHLPCSAVCGVTRAPA